MNAAVVTSYGAPPRYASFGDPVPGEGEQLVTVAAAALHPIVRAMASGKHYGSSGSLPIIPGVDGVGRLADGRRVLFGISRPPYGTFAELGLASAYWCLPLPEALDDVTAAALPTPAMSSWVALSARARFAYFQEHIRNLPVFKIMRFFDRGRVVNPSAQRQSPPPPCAPGPRGPAQS